MGLTVGNLNSANFFARADELISGSELSQVSKEILSAIPSAESAQTSQNLPEINLSKFQTVDNGLKVSDLNAQVVKQIATAQAGYDINLSQQALSAIETLKAQAAKLQVANLPSKMDGKIYIPSEVADLIDVKEVFTPNSPTQLFETASLTKDKRGFGSLFAGYTRKNPNQKQEGLNLII